MLFLVATAATWFDTNGPWRPIYALHDNVWLPFQGVTWTAIFPYGVIWLLIAAGLLTLLLSEYLGLASLLRQAQVRVIEMMIYRMPGFLVEWQRLLRAVGLRAGLVEIVLREMRDDALIGLTQELREDPGGNLFHLLVHCQMLLIRMGLRSPRDLVALVDTLGLSMLDLPNRGDSAHKLRVAALKLDPDGVEDWNRLAETPPFALTPMETIEVCGRIDGGDISPETLACLSIGVALATLADPRPERLAWFEIWAQVRAKGRGEAASRLAEAEALCAFEFWAAQAEDTVARRPVSTFLGAAFGDFSPVRARGEVFALRGPSEVRS